VKPRWPFRRHFVLFLLLSVFACAQLAWWVVFQVEEGARERRMQHDVWTQQIETVRIMLQTNGKSSSEFRAWLAVSFPDLVLSSTGEIAVSDVAQNRLDQTAHRRVRMFAWEGSFFVVILLVGIGYMFWTMQREIVFERSQSIFLAATSHELKTPITSLRIYLETLMDRDFPPAQRAEMLATMQKDLERLTDLIDRLLQTQAIAAHKQHPILRPTNLSDETRTVLEQFTGVFDLKGFQLEVALDRDLYAQADPDRWQIVVKNLLDNAFKYSPQGGVVAVRLKRADSRAHLEVTDSGIGFSKSEGERLFDRFYRVGNEDTPRTRGTGLGLYLVHGIVESFAGKVSAHSPGPGRGATFVVEIPLSAETADE
jgi:signal transduction histidine kinase